MSASSRSTARIDAGDDGREGLVATDVAAVDSLEEDGMGDGVEYRLEEIEAGGEAGAEIDRVGDVPHDVDRSALPPAGVGPGLDALLEHPSGRRVAQLEAGRFRVSQAGLAHAFLYGIVVAAED